MDANFKFLSLLPTDKQRPLQKLIGIWQELAKAAGGIPRRKDFSPVQLRSLAAHVSLLDYGGDDSLTYRLASAAVMERMGRNPVGLNLFDFMSRDIWPLFNRRLYQSATTPCGYFSYYRLERPNGSHEQILAVYLPLKGNTSDEIDHFIAFYQSAEIIDWQSSNRDEVFVGADGAVGGWFDIGYGTPLPESR
ncbi:PAS domain-containing protein [Gimibacter soli]|uniref:PAS domain-containing protein n=1 Tax=Gimibacter soli TaxID=3024400 RepID=A0AAF0BMC9_9PROT|nr:PAS domain-containing protein [Gimibacter soli]WCL55367.1 PAS domain-containing protein [Gimibacter soli]